MRTEKLGRISNDGNIKHALLALVILVVFILSVPLTLEAADRTKLKPRRIINKHSDVYKLSPNAEANCLVVKFNEGTGVRMMKNRLKSRLQGALQASAGVSTTSELENELDQVHGKLHRHGLSLMRTFSSSYERLAELKERGERRSGRELADLSLYYRIPAGMFSGVAQMERVAKFLNNLKSVEIAYIAPKPVPADAFTPNFTTLQTYKGPAPNGINADLFVSDPGGQGAGVTVIDVEQAWNVNHEDFPPINISLGVNCNTGNAASLCDPNGDSLNHGTAVVGIVAALDDTRGITGIAPDVTMGISGHSRARWSYKWGWYCDPNVPDAIDHAAENLDPGDVLIVEVQAVGPMTTTCLENENEIQCNMLPMEYWEEERSAIATAVANGIIVVQAAGNGSVNFDHPRYNGLLDLNDTTGAIMVGAGASTSRTPMQWSNYGSRVDVHSWGANVTTLGYGNLYSGSDDPDDHYKSDFGGTSAATPIVASAAAIIQGIASHTLPAKLLPLSPAQVRGLLRATGSPQIDRLDRHIGPQPNLAPAIALLRSGTYEPIADFDYTCNEQALCTFTNRSFDLRDQNSLQGHLGALTYSWQFSDGASSPDPNPTHQFTAFNTAQNLWARLQVTDGDGHQDVTEEFILISPQVCTDDPSMRLEEDFESASSSNYTLNGSATVSSAAAYASGAGILINGIGEIVLEVDVRTWDQFTFNCRAQAFNYTMGTTSWGAPILESIRFIFEPIIAGSVVWSQTQVHHSNVGRVGDEYGYENYEIVPWPQWDPTFQRVRVTIQANPQSTNSAATLYVDDVVMQGQRCQMIECIDDDFCDAGESCVDGTCTGGTGPVCTDAQCDDGVFCNGVETCGADGNCHPGAAVDCDDGFSCTTDTCNEALDQCDNTPNDSYCDDNDQCTIDTCDPSSSSADSEGCTNEEIPDCGSSCLGTNSICSSDDECCSLNCVSYFFFKICRP